MDFRLWKALTVLIPSNMSTKDEFPVVEGIHGTTSEYYKKWDSGCGRR